MTAAVALPVPYVTAYSEERVALNLTFIGDTWALSGLRLAYTDPAPSDWDRDVLWARQTTCRRGKALYEEVHTSRQKECMLGGLCQVCQRPAMDPRTERFTWVFHVEPPATCGRLSKPPICRECLREATTACPSLRREAHVYSSGSYGLWGVKGLVVSPDRKPVWRDVPRDDLHTLEFTLARALLGYVSELRRERV